MYFGAGGEELTTLATIKDALHIVEQAVDQCGDRETRTNELREALKYLQAHSPVTWPHLEFWRVLSCRDPIERVRRARACLNGIRRLHGLTPL